MSDTPDLSEFLDAYLGEADEHLTNANAQLLAIDTNLRSGAPVARQVRELFRALHTIKGLSAMVGVDPIVAIAHRMETVLRSSDRGGGHLTSEAVDLLLQGTRAIELRVRAVREHASPPDAPRALLDALDAFESEPRAQLASTDLLPLALDPRVATKLAPFEHEEILRAVLAGRRAICVWFAPSTALASVGVTIRSVREKLGSVAEIIKVVPISMPEGDDAPGAMVFSLVALTTLSDDEVAGRTEIERRFVVCVAEPPAAEAEPAAAEADPLMGADDGDALIDVRRSGVVRVEVSRLDQALEHLSALIISRSRLLREITRLGELGVDTRALGAIAREQSRQLKELRASILGLRMVPLTEVLDRVPLIVRGVRRSTGKTARLEVDVGRAELDKAVAERIFPAIVQLVRNAVDHGIEGREARLAAGKPDDGVVRIACAAVGNAQLELRVSDDGGGLDRAGLARRAGAPIPETDAATLALLCRRGISTRDRADATSGRGMGMDIVRRIVVEQLGGELSVHSEPGRGTTFALRVPLTISIVDALTFECSAQRFAVPLSAVDEIIEIDTLRVAYGPQRAGGAVEWAGVMERRGAALSVLRLDAALGLGHRAATGPMRPKGLIIRSDGESFAFVVDRMLGQQEIVVRPLTDPLLAVPGVTGATDLGDGKPTLILDLLALCVRHRGAGARNMSGLGPAGRTEHRA